MILPRRNEDMSEAFTSLLEKELQQCADITKVVKFYF